MSASVLISGRLFRQRERRECRNGGTMATTSLKVVENGSVQWWGVVSFGENAEALLSLEEGDAVSIAGKFEAGTYEDKAGETRISLKVIADKLISLKPRPAAESSPTRRRTPSKRPATHKTPAKVTRPAIDADLNDALPW